MRITKRYGSHASIDSSVFISHNVDLEIGDMTTIAFGVKIIGTGRVSFGDYCKIHPNTIINVGEGGSVVFGHNCWIGSRVILDGHNGIAAENNIGVGIGSQLSTHIEFGDTLEGCKFFSGSPMIIENDVWFASGCFVNPIHAKRKSIALMGTVITKDMEENHIYSGSPAKDVTMRYGSPWETTTPETKMIVLNKRIDEFFSNNLDYKKGCIISCIEFPSVADQNLKTSYFSVKHRTYTKRRTEVERKFLSWLTSSKGRFTPAVEVTE